MAQADDDTPGADGGKGAATAARQERQAQALRENLKRRKEQARARGERDGGKDDDGA